jgi:hypothetical protein
LRDLILLRRNISFELFNNTNWSREAIIAVRWIRPLETR